MSNVPVDSAHYADHPIWQRLASYTIGPEDAALSFADRLERENGWTVDHGARVIAEYKRFAFLAATLDHPVTPSDAVDQVWHLHLCYTRDYWELFCPEILGRPLHHGPTAGGDAELHRYFDQYAQTLKSYEETFGECPPEDLWPKAAKRLRHDPKARRVHPAESVIIPRIWVRRLFGAIIGMAVLYWMLD